jgi:hypothetical protein
VQIVSLGSSFVLFFLLVLSSCGREGVEPTRNAKGAGFTDQQISSLANKRVFFGHQSVGANIIQGIRDLMAEDPRFNLKIVSSAEPQSVSGPAFVEATIGDNRKPRSKNDAFLAILGKGLGAQGGIAMYKYCYLDIDSSADVQQIFEDYRKTVNESKSQYPLLKIVHVTVPLRTVEPTMKAWIKSLFGRATERDANVKRNEFNNLMRRIYGGTEPIFDLAAVESMRPDGSRSYFPHRNEKIFMLAPEFTADGGHLNEVGRRAAAERLLLLLAEL